MILGTMRWQNRLSIDELLAHDCEENAAAGHGREGVLVQQLFEQRDPGNELLFVLDGLESYHFPLVDSAVFPRIQNAMEGLVLALVESGKILIPGIIIQLRENGLHMRDFERVEGRMRDLSDIVPLDHKG